MGTFFGPSITVIFFPLFLSLPSALDFLFFFCAEGKGGEETRTEHCCVEQQLLLARSKGQQAWSS